MYPFNMYDIHDILSIPRTGACLEPDAPYRRKNTDVYFPLATEIEIKAYPAWTRSCCPYGPDDLPR